MSMNKKIIVGSIALFIFGVGFVLSMRKPSAETPSVGITNPATKSTDTSAPLEALNPAVAVSAESNTKTYTLVQVSMHADATSCWTAINGNVYDVTNWINQHPGGPEKILSLCGKDGSFAFNQKHGGGMRPEQQLTTFLIGALQK